MDSKPLRHTAPLWLLDHFLTSGQDVGTTCATATFVRRRGRHYLVTCEHVQQTLVRRRRSGEMQKTLALRIGRTSLSLSSVGPGGVNLPLLTPLYDSDSNVQTDIAIAPLTDSYWNILATQAGKLAVDLDRWRAPDWSRVSCCLATGYLNERKAAVTRDGSDYIETPFLQAIAELASDTTTDSPSFALSSRLEEPDDVRLSGTSGGLVYAVGEANSTM